MKSFLKKISVLVIMAPWPCLAQSFDNQHPALSPVVALRTVVNEHVAASGKLQTAWRNLETFNGRQIRIMGPSDVSIDILKVKETVFSQEISTRRRELEDVKSQLQEWKDSGLDQSKKKKEAKELRVRREVLKQRIPKMENEIELIKKVLAENENMKKIGLRRQALAEEVAQLEKPKGVPAESSNSKVTAPRAGRGSRLTRLRGSLPALALTVLTAQAVESYVDGAGGSDDKKPTIPIEVDP